MRVFACISIILIHFEVIKCQENAQPRVSKSLVECYYERNLLDRENRLPMTIGTLINLITKVENSPGFNQDIRQLAASLIHRFRLDGIVKAQGVAASAGVLPYSPSGFQFSKHKILLTRLIPGDAKIFPNDTLTAIERCTLHFMLSSSFELGVRGDEGERCSQLAQYRSERIPRSVVPLQDKTNYVGDFEFLDKYNKNKKSKVLSDKLKRDDKKMEYEDEQYDEFEEQQFDLGVDVARDLISQCPLENGVLYTKWGAVAGGPLIAGIAAGLQPQKVQLRTLLALAPRSRAAQFRNGQQNEISVDNKWAATLSGDLSEVALLQMPIYPTNNDVGAPGAWNDTVNQKWYFLSQKEKLEMTDAEIRGGLDGLIMATKIAEWRGKASGLKLSQLLSMYYSQGGVLDSGIRACDRKKHFTEFAPLDKMKIQTAAFANVLDKEMQLRVTLKPEAIKQFAQLSVEKLSAYIPTMNDLSCETTLPTPNDPTEIEAATDLYVFLDTTWQFNTINAVLSYIFNNVNINVFDSRITLLNAADGKVIVNTTNSLIDIKQGWNVTTQETHPRGLNLPNVLKEIHSISINLMAGEQKNSSVGGRSLVALIVPYTATVNEGDSNFASERLLRIHEEVPDLKILILASGSANRFSKFVVNENKDLFTARQGDNVALQAMPVVKRIKEIPRRIINHRCGPNWSSDQSGQNQMNEYLTPGTVNLHRLASNYFFGENSNRKIRIQGQGTSSITVCSSRSNELPRTNMTNKPDDLNCRPLTSNSFEIDLSNPCEGHYEIHNCPSYYLSVESAKQIEGNGQTRCMDADCKYPSQIKYLIQTDSLGCWSGVSRNMSNILLILLSFYTIFFAFTS